MPAAPQQPATQRPGRRPAIGWLAALAILAAAVLVGGGLTGYRKYAWYRGVIQAQDEELADLRDWPRHAFHLSDAAVERITEVRDALRDHDVALLVVAMPSWWNLHKPDPHSQIALVDRPDADSAAAWIALRRLENAGIATIDLWDDLRRTSLHFDIWSDDRHHLSASGLEKAGELLGHRVERALPSVATGDSFRRLTFMGECFAVDLADQFTALNPEFDVRSVRSYGDPGRVVNLVFSFPEDYLDGRDAVVWVMPHEWLLRKSLPPLRRLDPEADASVTTATVRIERGLGVTVDDLDARLPRLPYPNALAELTASLVDASPTMPQEIVLVGYAVRDRRRQGLAEISAGENLVVRMQDFDAKVAESRAVGSECYLTRQDDFERPRFWMVDWVKEVDSTLARERPGVDVDAAPPR